MVAEVVAATYDIFISYRTRRFSELDPIVAALEQRGLRVFRDIAENRSGGSITDSVRQGLASSRAFAVYASEDWSASPICAWELATAWSAATRIDEGSRRVLLLQPEGVDNLSQVRLGRLRDCLSFDLRGPAIERAAQELADHLATLDARPLGAIADLTRSPRWYPYRREGSSRFVGRAREMWDLEAMLSRTRTVGITGQIGQDIAQVRGLAGVGKSLLAIEYARRFEMAWPGGIFWFEADPSWGAIAASPAAVLDRRHALLAGLAPHLGVDVVAGDLAATAGAVTATLSQRTGGQRYLWVVDNLPPGVNQATVEALLPPDKAGALLVTTRFMALESVGERLDLNVLDPAAAYELLTKRRPPLGAAEVASARALAKEVGHHPLALDVLGALVRDALGDTPYASWCERLAARDDRFDERAEQLSEELPTNSRKAIGRVLASSLEKHSATALDVLRTASILGDAPIPGGLLTAILGMHNGVSEDDVEQAVGELATDALVKRVEGSIEVHALVRRVARRWNVDTSTPVQLTAMATRVLCSRFAEAVDDIRQHGPLLPLLPHASTLSSESSAEAAGLAADLGVFLGVRGDLTGAREREERALAARERILGPEHPDTLTTLQNLAGTLLAQGDLAGARERYERVLAAYEHIQGPEHPDTLRTLNNLAVTLQEQGDLAGARERHERVLAAYERIQGTEHPDTLNMLNNLAGVLDAQGDLAGARERYERALAAYERILGVEHPHTLSTLQNLAVTLKAQGDLAGARERYERALAARERILGPEHPDTLNTLQNLAVTLKAQGDLAGARERYERALAARERILGPEHADTLRTLQNLAGTFFAQGDLAGARERYERALASFERILGVEHPHTLSTLQNLAVTLKAQGDLAGARERLERALAAQERTLGPKHPDTLRTRHNLAGTLKAQEDLARNIGTR
jgi:tetratricopeptide (TPR) repeat protein